MEQTVVSLSSETIEQILQGIRLMLYQGIGLLTGVVLGGFVGSSVIKSMNW